MSATDAEMSALLDRLPSDRLYAPEQDMWVRFDADGTACVGATHVVASHGQFMLFTPRPAGADVARDRSLGVMETAKTAVAIHAPISGRIVEANAGAVGDVALVERDCYGAGWLFRIAPSALEAERASLLDAAGYAAWLAPRLAERRSGPTDDDADIAFDPTRGW